MTKPNLSVVRFNDDSNSHYASEWMSKRQDNIPIKCDVRLKSTRCFCDPQLGDCWDFDNIMETIYLIPRDNMYSSVPNGAYNNSGNGIKAVGTVQKILDILYENSFELSQSLIDKSNRPLVEKYEERCRLSTPISKNDVSKLIDRGEMGMRINPVNRCIEFFSRGYMNLQKDSISVLRIREKFIQQINSCENNSSNESLCQFSNFKDLIPQKMKKFLQYQNTKFDKENLKLGSAKDHFNWNSNEKNGNTRTRGIIFCWIFAGILMFLIVMIIRSACTYKSIEERKPLNTELFKLKDIEKELRIAFSGKNPEKSLMTMQAQKNLEKAMISYKRKEKKQKGTIIKSIQLPTPREESDLGSYKSKNNSKKQTDQQEDIAEAITPEILQPPAKPKRPTGEGNEKSVQSKTEQESLVNKKKSDDAVEIKSIQKTQSLLSPELTALTIDHPRVQRTPRKIPSDQGLESKREKRSKSKSSSPEKTSGKAKSTPKKKNRWYRFWK